MLNNTTYNNLRCIRCVSQGNSKPYTYTKVKQIGKKKGGPVVTRTYRKGTVKVPLCPSCTESFLKWVKRKRLLITLALIPMIIMIIFGTIFLITDFLIPMMDYDPFGDTEGGFVFEHIFPLIIPFIAALVMGIIIFSHYSSDSNPGNHIRFGQNRVGVTPSNTTRKWFLESWNQIVTEEQLEAERLYIMAGDFYNEKNFIEAIKFYDKALALFPEYTDAIHDKKITLSKI